MLIETTRPAVVVNLGGLALEPHVDEALGLAWETGGGHPLGAGLLLRAAIARGRDKRSRAFFKLAELLPITPPPPAKRVAVLPMNRSAVPFERPLANSFFIAESFLSGQKRVWGRDYVTIGLLTDGDPSLEALSSEAGRDLASLRAEWLDYLRSSGRHRKPEVWEQWFRAASVPIADPSGSTDAPTTAYLMTWNPDLYPIAKMRPLVDRLRDEGSCEFGWSTGNRLSMAVGDRVFLVRQGVEPRGLVGVGEVIGDVEQMPHWRSEQRAAGKTSNIVTVRWEALAIDPFLDRSSLISLTDERQLWSSGSGGVEIAADAYAKLESAWRGAWARHAHGLAQPLAPDLEPRNWIARFDADRGRDDDADSLNIDRYVNAFARVMASSALEPPLSIGLFGDWGSGKTFFMDRLHAKILELSASPAGDQDPPVYWPRICQIRFNAWHYAETDLWASLVSTIFTELRRYLDGPADDGDEFNKLLNELELATELRKENEKRLEAAEERLELARRHVIEAEESLRAVPAPAPLTDEQLRKALDESLTEVSSIGSGGIQDLLRKAADMSGNTHLATVAARVEEGKNTIGETRALLMETQGLLSRTGFWWRVLSTAKLHRSRWFWVFAAIVVTIPVGFFFLQGVVDFAVGWAAVLSETLVVVASAVAWCRARLASAAPVFDRLDQLQSAVERRIESAKSADRKAYEERVAKTEAEKAAAESKAAHARTELERAEEAERAARVALRESTSQARLGRFIRERAESADYDKYLGLIAMIHRDFDKLSSLMRDARKGVADPDLPRVDRIVLYVDDLDRCYPPDKVVRVLEAVHLLLFFPLFVVVVGVDSRWVSRALNRYYEGMLADESVKDAHGAGLQRAPADSQDFLEKIFQVPFWLRRMDPSAIKRMIHRLITAQETELGFGHEPPTNDGDGEVDDVMGISFEPDGDGAGPEETTVVIERLTNVSAIQRVTQEAEADAEMIGERLADLPTESLCISEAELRFMEAVAPLMPRTPRSVKRFVNIYRLYKAALSTPALGSFMGTPARPGNFRAVQVLLALVTGTPLFAKAVVDGLERSNGAGPSDLASLVESDSFGVALEESWTTTLEALRHFAQGPNNLDLAELRAVSPLVCRYSVHHMVSESPGGSALG